jgi:hypothetical protein
VYKVPKVLAFSAFLFTSLAWLLQKRQNSPPKLRSTTELVGCSIHQLAAHLESQFQVGMSWDNFGRGIGHWSVDHIKPCAAFRLEDEQQQRACFQFRNLRPMWFSENCRKGSNWSGRKSSHTDHADHSALPDGISGA